MELEAVKGKMTCMPKLSYTCQDKLAQFDFTWAVDSVPSEWQLNDQMDLRLQYLRPGLHLMAASSLTGNLFSLQRELLFAL